MLFWRQTFCTFSSFTRKGFYTVLLPTLFNVKRAWGKMQYFLLLVIYTIIWFLICSSHICTSWSSWQAAVQWKDYSPNQASTAVAVICGCDSVVPSASCALQSYMSPWCVVSAWVVFLSCSWGLGSSAGFLLVKVMLSREGLCLWKTVCADRCARDVILVCSVAGGGIISCS